jgi:hypothetical protein
MSGFDTNIIIQWKPFVEGCKSIKQKLRRTHPDILTKGKIKIEKM